MKTLFFDCFAGASGNMILGGLVALGVDRDELVSRIAMLDVPDFRVVFAKRDKSGINAVYAEVTVPDEHVHRHLHHIEKIIGGSRLPDSVKARSLAIFTRLAAAEAKIHGIEIGKVHFHEVGAMDAIIDIVGACIGFEMLGIERFACSALHVGSGFAKMAHGTFPVPPPAVAELLTGAPVYSTEIAGELVTPTGAAIIATVCAEFGPMPEMVVERTGYGAGTRDYKDFPNALRLIIGDSKDLTAQHHRSSHGDALCLLETNLDDVSAELLGYFMDKALEDGAVDCWFTPIQMKKNRPGTLVSVLCAESAREKFLELMIRETPTLGVRISKVERQCLERESVVATTRYGDVPVKIARFAGAVVNAKPEHDEIRKIAAREQLPLRQVEAEIKKDINL